MILLNGNTDFARNIEKYQKQQVSTIQLLHIAGCI